jgi:glycosyltransferase involved in cell wall biosynthesis
MINIISTQARHSNITGPAKVFRNLVKGLDKIGYPYVINRDLNATKRLWIHDDITALRYMHRSKAYKVVGPNLFVMPSDIPPGISFDGALYLQPCEWAKQVWELVGFNACPIAAWPVGIDTDEFLPVPVPQSKRHVLVYHKMRDPQELPRIFEALHNLRLDYRFALYGDYTEVEYKQLLSKTSFVVWHGRAESQGIALQEAMACNIPILLCDVTSVAQTRGGYAFTSELHNFPVTAAPYFSELCGIRITDLNDLPGTLERMCEMQASFQPRQYVLENLSLQSQAQTLIRFWENWDMSFEQGLTETCMTNREWSGHPLLPQLAKRGWEKLKPALADTLRRIR